MRRHSGRQQYNEALIIAREHGLKVVHMPGRWLLYRIVPGADRGTFIGSRGSVEGLRQLVAAAAGSR